MLGDRRFPIGETAVPSARRGGTVFLECRYQMAVLLTPTDWHGILKHLSAHEGRNAMIVQDVCKAVEAGRCPLVLRALWTMQKGSQMH